MSFEVDDIIMHKTEGWYGIVMGYDAGIYRVKNLEPIKFYQENELILADRADIPAEFQDLSVDGNRVEKIQPATDHLWDLIQASIHALDSIPRSTERNELTDLLFKAKDIADNLRMKQAG